MNSTVKHLVKKVTLELIYDVVDERTKTINNRIDELREEIKAINSRIDQINFRIDQLHSRLDQIMHLLLELKK
jgi:flagellar capping protein FliD